ncbi:MAG TPA: hypothetical protein EYP60_06530 [bacterium (Candidatus Stahlbacteria)]|nr:hypothetical protein [Candidatus Stahlbacteria bacterium]
MWYLIFILITSNIESLQQLYNNGEYLTVIEKAEESLKDTLLTNEDRVGIHTILAFSYIALNKNKLAKLEFLEALCLNPLLELDPMLVSPKILKVWTEARNTFRLLPQRIELEKPPPKRDLLSIAVPGLYDIRCGRERGFFLLAGEAVGILGTLISHYMCERAHKDYLNAETPSLIESKYKIYGLWYNGRTFFLTSTILLYLIHLLLLAKG